MAIAITAAQILSTAALMIPNMEADKVKTRQFMDYELGKVAELQHETELAAISCVISIAAQLPGELTVTEDNGVLYIAKGGHHIATWDGRCNMGTLESCVAHASLTLTRLATAVFELDCPTHQDAAKKVVTEHLNPTGN